MELGDKDPKRLRVASHEAMKKSDEHLSAIISESKANQGSGSKDAGSVISMCLHTLVTKVRSSQQRTPSHTYCCASPCIHFPIRSGRIAPVQGAQSYALGNCMMFRGLWYPARSASSARGRRCAGSFCAVPAQLPAATCNYMLWRHVDID